MATTFMEPGGDATFLLATTTAGGFWSAVNGGSVVTDIVHGGHIKSYKPTINSASGNWASPVGSMTDAGGRVSVWVYVNALPTATTDFLALTQAGGGANLRIRMTSAGVLQAWSTTVQLGSNGSTLSTGTWYRLSLAETISTTTSNEFRLFKDGTIDISLTNVTIAQTTSSKMVFGYERKDGTFDTRFSDVYQDNSAALTDPGTIWVTAKRPFANGTTNGFTTQIGSGGSGYGTGHSPQVNERALSVTNGWSVVAAGSAITEEYNIEGATVGDISLAGATIVDYTGWIYAKALLSETAQLVLNGATANVSLTSTNTMFTTPAGSTTYPAGTGTDIGIVSATTATTVSLFECGVMVAYIPGTGARTGRLTVLGVS